MPATNPSLRSLNVGFLNVTGKLLRKHTKQKPVNILPHLLTHPKEHISSWEKISSSDIEEIVSAVAVIGLADVLGG